MMRILCQELKGMDGMRRLWLGCLCRLCGISPSLQAHGYQIPQPIVVVVACLLSSYLRWLNPMILMMLECNSQLTLLGLINSMLFKFFNLQSWRRNDICEEKSSHARNPFVCREIGFMPPILNPGFYVSVLCKAQCKCCWNHSKSWWLNAMLILTLLGFTNSTIALLCLPH